eukprot:CAMPEP_0170177478 /NCGR_PEP_ID=MMETSP0040_2-20121228/10112_1 /TAXON_ID=641309 /ORGANISM="Lotharella oceanica, Strain CCMP622" /LENGTH=298 /DNA_ID=CAMNT_0010420125 /DNA_START=69 /DNA_END=965 /DNA_ORIENTATION=-
MIALGPGGTFVNYEKKKSPCWSRGLPTNLWNLLNGRYNNCGQKNSRIQALAYTDDAFIIGYEDGGGKYGGNLNLDWDDIGALEYAALGPQGSYIIVGSRTMVWRGLPARMVQLLKTRNQYSVASVALGSNGGYFLLYTDGAYYYGGGLNSNLRKTLDDPPSNVTYVSMCGQNYFVEFADGSQEWCGPTRLTNHLKHSCYMSHKEIRYSNTSISSTFSEGGSVRELAKDLENERCYVEDVPMIRVVKVDGLWHSLDNRRLWAFSLAEITDIPVQILSPSRSAIQRVRKLKNRGTNIHVR